MASNSQLKSTKLYIKHDLFLHAAVTAGIILDDKNLHKEVFSLIKQRFKGKLNNQVSYAMRLLNVHDKAAYNYLKSKGVKEWGKKLTPLTQKKIEVRAAEILASSLDKASWSDLYKMSSRVNNLKNREKDVVLIPIKHKFEEEYTKA